MQLLEDAFCSRRLPAPEQHRRPLAAQAAEKEAEERSSRSLAAHDSGSSEGDQEVQRCEVGMHHDHSSLPLSCAFHPRIRHGLHPAQPGCA